MLLHSIFYRPPVRVEQTQEEFECRVCGKKQMGQWNQVVCPGRDGACRKEWQRRLDKKKRTKRKKKDIPD